MIFSIEMWKKDEHQGQKKNTKKKEENQWLMTRITSAAISLPSDWIRYFNRGRVLTKSAGTKAELKSGVGGRARGMSDDVVWFRLVLMKTSPHSSAQFHYYELSQYTHMPLVIMMSLNKVRKGLDGFRCATKLCWLLYRSRAFKVLSPNVRLTYSPRTLYFTIHLSLAHNRRNPLGFLNLLLLPLLPSHTPPLQLIPQLILNLLSQLLPG